MCRRRRTGPPQCSGLHVPGGLLSGVRAGLPRDCAAHAWRLLPVCAGGRARAGRTAACGGGVRRRWHEGAGRFESKALNRRGSAARATEVVMPFLLGVVVLILLLWAVNVFSKADPKQAARILRYIGGG